MLRPKFPFKAFPVFWKTSVSRHVAKYETFHKHKLDVLPLADYGVIYIFWKAKKTRKFLVIQMAILSETSRGYLPARKCNQGFE